MPVRSHDRVMWSTRNYALGTAGESSRRLLHDVERIKQQHYVPSWVRSSILPETTHLCHGVMLSCLCYSLDVLIARRPPITYHADAGHAEIDGSADSDLMREQATNGCQTLTAPTIQLIITRTFTARCLMPPPLKYKYPSSVFSRGRSNGRP